MNINSAVDDLKEYDPELALNLQKRANALKADWQRKQEQERAEWKEEDKQTTIKVSRDRVLLETAALTVLCGMTLSWTFLKSDRGSPEPPAERAARSDLAREGVIDAEYVEVGEKDEPKPPTPEGDP